MRHMKKSGKWGRRAGVLALSLGTLVVLFQSVFYLYFRDFYSRAERIFWVPGLSESFVPQGIYAWNKSFLLSGYLSSNGSARLIWVEPDGDERILWVLREDGTMLRSHAGGVAVSEQYTYLAGGNGICYVLSTEELMDPDCRAVTILGEFSTGNRASFCSRQGGLLLIGEHARGEKFRTADAHHLTTPAGEENPALVTVFQLDDEETLGVSTSPVAAYSIPGRAQGMSFTSDGRAMLSASGAMGASQVYFYDLQAMRGGQQDVFRVLDTEVPLYYLDSSCCQEVLHLPPMAEEIAFENSKLYVLFESASCRFRYGRLVGGDYVYALDPPPRQEREA